MNGWEILFQTLAAFIGTLAFSVFFHVQSKHYLLCGGIGAAGWLCYQLLYPVVGVVEACFFATVVIIILSRFFSIRRRCPVTVYLISGIFPLVPGAGIYWTAYYCITQQSNLAISKGLETLQIAVAIVLGIVLVLEIPQKVFVKRAKA